MPETPVSFKRPVSALINGSWEMSDHLQSIISVKRFCWPAPVEMPFEYELQWRDLIPMTHSALSLNYVTELQLLISLSCLPTSPTCPEGPLFNYALFAVYPAGWPNTIQRCKDSSFNKLFVKREYNLLPFSVLTRRSNFRRHRTQTKETKCVECVSEGHGFMMLSGPDRKLPWELLNV